MVLWIILYVDYDRLNTAFIVSTIKPIVKTASITIKINDSIALITFITICIATTNAIVANIHPMIDSNVDPNDFSVFMNIF